MKKNILKPVKFILLQYLVKSIQLNNLVPLNENCNHHFHMEREILCTKQQMYHLIL